VIALGVNVRPLAPTWTTWTVFPDAEVATTAAAVEVVEADEDEDESEPYCAKATGSAASTMGSVEKNIFEAEFELD
jgi:hypothetical protein